MYVRILALAVMNLPGMLSVLCSLRKYISYQEVCLLFCGIDIGHTKELCVFLMLFAVRK